MSPDAITFLWGVAGSLIAEFVTLYTAVSSKTGEMPEHYKRPLFWICRVIMACIGGGLAVGYGITANHYLAMNVGASAPLIIQSLTTGVPSLGAGGPKSRKPSNGGKT